MALLKAPAPTLPRLISTKEAADLLQVTQRTVENWIARGLIPYLELPRSGERSLYRIPLQGLLSTLSGTYDLAAELLRLDQAAEDGRQMSEDEVLANLRASRGESSQAEE